MKTTFIWIGVIVVAIITLIFWGRETQDAGLSFELGVINAADNIKGNADSPVVVMEYSDFQCPACRTYYPVMRELMTEFGDRVVFVYRYFPLISIHANAEFAARASQAAAKQGKFWEMHNLLFQKQNEWSNVADVGPVFESYASLIGISVEQFKIDKESPEVKDFVRSQRIHAVRSGLQGTPSFFVSGKRIENPTSILEFRTIINQAIEDSRQPLP